MQFTLPKIKLTSKREQIAFALAVCAIFIVMSDRLVFSPWLNHRKKIQKEIKSLEQILAGRSLLLSRKDIVAIDEEVNQKYIHKARSSEVEIADFLKEIESLALQSHVSLQEVRPIPAEGGEWYQEYGLEVHFIASLPEWVQLLYLMETSSSVLTIDRVTVGLEKEDSKTLKGVMRIKRLVVLDKPAASSTEE